MRGAPLISPYALLFPGQGSQYVGMGRDFLDSSNNKSLPEEAKSLVQDAEDTLQIPLKRLMLEGPELQLTNTAIAQPAILLHSVLAFQALCAQARENTHELSFSCALGHSLGEYSALVAAEVISLIDALKAVHQRGQLMQEAVPQGQGAMAAVLGLEPEKIVQILAEFSDNHGLGDTSDSLSASYVAPANFNGPGQTVIAGTKLGVEKASEALKLAGAKKIINLAVSAPFHCALMKPVQAGMKEVLDRISFSTPKFPLISNVSALPETSPERIKALLIEQIISPVRFTECVAAAHKLNHKASYIELGPKNILSSLVKKIDLEAIISNIDNLKDLEKINLY